MNRRQPLAIAVIWLATVASASTVTWGVISATGAQVGQAIAPITPLATESATRRPSATPSTGPTASLTPPKPSNSARPTTAKPTSPPPSQARITDTWSGSVGTVTASCTGSTLKLVSAVPAVGYRVRVEREDGQLEVDFVASSQDGEGERDDDKAAVKVTCSDGRPVFRTR